MYLYKKNIILVPSNYDGVSMSKGILSLDCYADKTVCTLRTYNLNKNGNLTLGVTINKKLNKINLNGSLNNQKFDLPMIINNTDNISVVLLDIKQAGYDIVLWGSTELNTTWRSTLEFMLSEEFAGQNNNLNAKEQEQSSQKEQENFANTQSFDDEFLKQNEYKDLNSGDVLFDDLKDSSDFCLYDAGNLSNEKILQAKQSENLAQQSFENKDEILKDQNLDEFLDSVISMEQGDDKAEYNENSSHLEDTTQQTNTFYDRISYQVEKMFVSNEKEQILDEIIPNSKFCRVEFDDKSGYYIFGIVYEADRPKYLCYGVPAKKDSEPPKELTNFYQWLPVDVEDENGDGYYMMYQDALTGKNISVEII
ncbi:MAG: hypothetical protein ACI4TT_03585 [Christensenellales bacterium]